VRLHVHVRVRVHVPVRARACVCVCVRTRALAHMATKKKIVLIVANCIYQITDEQYNTFNFWRVEPFAIEPPPTA